MPSELAAGSVKLAEFRAHCSRGSSVLDGYCPRRKEDVGAHLAPERDAAGGRAGPIAGRRVLRGAAYGKRSAVVDGAVAVDVPAVEDGGRHFSRRAAAVGNVISHIEIDGLRAVGNVLAQLGVDPLVEGESK